MTSSSGRLARPTEYRENSSKSGQRRGGRSPPSPFQAGNGGLSARHWDTKQLQRLSVDFYGDCPLFTAGSGKDDGVVPSDYQFSRDQQFSTALKDLFGLEWSTIKNMPDISAHPAYYYLLKLERGRPKSPLIVGSSSATPPSSPPAQVEPPSSPPVESSLALRTRGSSDDPRTPTKQALPTTELEDPTSPSWDRRRSSRIKASPVTPRSTTRSDAPSPDSPRDDEEDLFEEDVRTSVENCILVLSAALNKVAGPDSFFIMTCRTPGMVSIEIDELMCKCKPDHELIMKPKLQAGSKKRFAHVFAEDKRFKHQMEADNILGQEVAYLTALVSLRSDDSQTSADTRHAYLLSWHHLTCYLTRMDTTQGKVASLAKNLSSTQSEPFKVYRSCSYDMKDSRQRLEFLSGVMSALVGGLNRFGSLKKELKRLYVEDSTDQE